MRNGKNILRMQADEEDVYHLMDLKELYFVLIGLGSFIEGIAVYFLLFKIRCWDLIYLCVVLFLGIFLLLRQSNKISKRIMEAEGSHRGIPEFYIVLRENENRESFFLLDEEEQNRTIFLVRSFGFNHQRFTEFYRKLRWNVPGKTRIIGTKNQEVWNLRKPNIEVCIVAGMIACYVIPKLLEVMKLH